MKCKHCGKEIVKELQPCDKMKGFCIPEEKEKK